MENKLSGYDVSKSIESSSSRSSQSTQPLQSLSLPSHATKSESETNDLQGIIKQQQQQQKEELIKIVTNNINNDNDKTKSIIKSCNDAHANTSTATTTWNTTNVLKSISNESTTNEFISFLSCTTKVENTNVDTTITSSNNNKNKSSTPRTKASLLLLNTIHDSCSIYLVSSNKIIENKINNKIQKQRYNQEFPSVLNNDKVVAAGAATTNKSKKRVTPSQITINASTINNAWSNSNINHTSNMKQQQQQSVRVITATSKSINNKTKRRIRPANALTTPGIAGNNIASLPSEDPSILRKQMPIKKNKNKQLQQKKNALQTQNKKETLTNNSKVLDNKNVTNPTKMEKIPREEIVLSSSQKQESIKHDESQTQEAKKNTSKVEKEIKKPIEILPKEIKEEQIKRLSKIYSKIILLQLIIPNKSMLLELHFLFRLLSISEAPTTTSSTSASASASSSAYYNYLFIQATDCKMFAIQTLEYLLYPIILHLPLEILNSILVYPSISSIPSLYNPIKTHVNKLKIHHVYQDDKVNNNNSIVNSNNILLNQPSHLNLKFNMIQDSRNYYKTSSQNITYTNREKVRDLFYNQLRSWQNNNFKSINNKNDIRYIINFIDNNNMFWFVTMFIELLGNIGYVDIEEIDQEIVNTVEDAQRLKKLHSRFTNKSCTTNNTSASGIRMGNNNNNDNMNTMQQQYPEYYFKGYQIFFYYFIINADSFAFNTFLQRRLISEIIRSSSKSDNYIEKIMNQKLLAKFLGVLLFSPNWNTSGTIDNPYHIHDNNDTNDSVSSSSLAYKISSNDALNDYNNIQPIFPIHTYIEQACITCNLVTYIPWIIEYLRMMIWDSLSLHSNYYRNVLGMLYSLYRFLSNTVYNNNNNSNNDDNINVLHSNWQIIIFELQSLLSDIVGIINIHALPTWDIPVQLSSFINNNNYDTTTDINTTMNTYDINKKSFFFDNKPIYYPTIFLSSLCSNVQELCDLLTLSASSFTTTATTSSSLKSSDSSSKKVRPYPLHDSNSYDNIDVENEDQDNDNNDNNSASLKLKGTKNKNTNTTSPIAQLLPPQPILTQKIKDKLINDQMIQAFFTKNHHPNFHNTCIFITTHVITTVTSNLRLHCMQPFITKKMNIFKDKDLSKLKKDDIIPIVEKETCDISINYFRKQCSFYITKCMQYLYPYSNNSNSNNSTSINIDRKVRDFGISILINYITNYSQEDWIHLIVQVECKKLFDDFFASF